MSCGRCSFYSDTTIGLGKIAVTGTPAWAQPCHLMQTLLSHLPQAESQQLHSPQKYIFKNFRILENTGNIILVSLADMVESDVSQWLGRAKRGFLSLPGADQPVHSIAVVTLPSITLCSSEQFDP